MNLGERASYTSWRNVGCGWIAYAMILLIQRWSARFGHRSVHLGDNYISLIFLMKIASANTLNS